MSDRDCDWPNCNGTATYLLDRPNHWSDIVREKIPYQVCGPHFAELSANGGWEPGYLPSNGTEGEIFRRYTCAVCVHDHEWHRHDDGLRDEPDETCPVMMAALIAYPNPGPEEWQEHYDTGEKRCTKFEHCECRRD